MGPSDASQHVSLIFCFYFFLPYNNDAFRGPLARCLRPVLLLLVPFRWPDGPPSHAELVGRSKPKAECNARMASSRYFSSITQESLISDVLIIMMLMPSPDNTSNI